MNFTPRIRKLVLTAHVTTSVGWLGAVLAYLSLVAAALTTSDADALPSAWFAMDVVLSSVIVPLAAISLVIGVANAFGTPWGLFRHYWVVVKLLLTSAATLILLLHAPTVGRFASSATGVIQTRSGLVGEIVHGAGGAAVLLVALVLSVYKPAGLTRYGWRRQHGGGASR